MIGVRIDGYDDAAAAGQSGFWRDPAERAPS